MILANLALPVALRGQEGVEFQPRYINSPMGPVAVLVSGVLVVAAVSLVVVALRWAIQVFIRARK